MLDLAQCNFDFRGFSPDQEFLAFLKTVAEQIQVLSPNESFINIEINRKNSFYVGFINVNSAPARFCAADNEDDPKLLVLKLASQIQRQIKNWKRFRFSKPYSEADVQAI
ncbi:MAG: hypothetical protein A4S09_13235 [Proteobacteria bacterium SG_bin7]|nr:MAG: hypothetical protein A4S09_13235 [Proteobacteria bacterium SG_bin7]